MRVMGIGWIFGAKRRDADQPPPAGDALKKGLEYMQKTSDEAEAALAELTRALSEKVLDRSK